MSTPFNCFVLCSGVFMLMASCSKDHVLTKPDTRSLSATTIDSIKVIGQQQVVYATANEFLSRDPDDFIGEIVKGTTINTLAIDPFNFFTAKRHPLQLRAQFTDGVVKTATAEPSVSATRLAVAGILASHPGERYGTLSYELDPMHDVREFKLYAGRDGWIPFLSNYAGVARTVVRLKFIAKHFNVAVEKPVDGQLYDAPIPQALIDTDEPLLVNSVQYGRLGLAFIISDDSFEEVSDAYAALFAQANGGAVMTSEQAAVLARCSVLGRSFSYIDGSELMDLRKVILQARKFTNNTPGGPVSFTLQYAKDFKPFVNHFTLKLPK